MAKLIKGFSWKRAVGISSAKQKFANKTGIPTSKQSIKRKRNSIIAKLLGFK
ncbi:MAG: hypothetical protein ACQEP4_02730 [Bacillota bacterium]